jgi:hypothetical protein|tara:strand:- start:208 stop:456 length:249 start_codon:yes stop_codon:yes gene_type:complete
MEEKKQNGGKRKGAGRKSKSEEQNLIEKLSPLEGQALKVFKDALNDDKQWAVKMYFEYMYGKPIETKIVDVSTDTPIFNITD